MARKPRRRAAKKAAAGRALDATLRLQAPPAVAHPPLLLATDPMLAAAADGGPRHPRQWARLVAVKAALETEALRKGSVGLPHARSAGVAALIIGARGMASPAPAIRPGPDE